MCIYSVAICRSNRNIYSTTNRVSEVWVDEPGGTDACCLKRKCLINFDLLRVSIKPSQFFHRRFSERLYLIWRFLRCHIGRTYCQLEGVDRPYTAQWNTIYVGRSLSGIIDRVCGLRVFGTGILEYSIQHRLYDIDCRFGRVRNRGRY